MPTNIQFAQSAFGDGFATADLGPGSLALLTGDYQISDTDADAASSLGGLSVGRTLTTLAPVDTGLSGANQRTDATGVFGPSWTADLAGPDAGDADLKLTDKTSYLLFTDTDGGVDTYQATSATSTYPVTYAAVGAAAGTGATVTKTNATTVKMTDSDGTVTTWTKASSGWQTTSVAQPGSNSTSTYSYNPAGLVTRILAPVPAGITCTSPDTTPGCRSLVLTYQSVTVGGSTVQRLQNVALSLPQTAGTANSVTVAAYDYTSSGLLADAYDPRITPNLKTGYTYDTAGRLATLTPPGQAAYTFGYDATGRLSTISRLDPSGSTAVQTIVYSVPTTGSSAPVDLPVSQTGTWAEMNDLPVTGTAIFPASHQPGNTVTSTDRPYATINYLDVNDRQVNTAQYGAGDWQLDTSQYDTNGNTVWDLTAGNRAQALSPTPATDPYVANLSNNVDRANLLASTTAYNPLNPAQVTDTYGPTHPVTLNSGTTIDARTHTATTYDEGAPNNDVDPATGAAYGLATTVVSDPYNVATATDTGYPDAATTRTGYDPIVAGDPSGWTLHRGTSSIVQMGSSPSSSTDLTTYTRYNSAGQTIETRLPGDANGTTPRTTDTTYYTASGSGNCTSAAQAALVCSTTPAAQPTSGKPLPVVGYTYNQYGDLLTKAETYGTGAGQDVRSTTTTYDAAERRLTNAVSVTPASAGGTAVPAVTYGYDASTGLPTTTNTGPDITLTSGYDTLGRVTSYTDATGNVSTTTYDIDGHVASLNDGKGTITYTYNSDSEHRGLVTSEDVGVTGSPSTFSASYDAVGNLASETYPNGLTATTTYDNAGNATKLVYAKSGSTWMTFTATNGDGDRTVAQTSPKSNQTFSYDHDGRLTTVQDTYNSSCTTRGYGYDADSNRTSLKTYPAAGDGSCTTSTTATTTSSSYDQADRLTNTGYTYDDLGRTLTVPGSNAQGIAGHAGDTGTLTVGYYANDMVAVQSQGNASVTFTLDPLQNRINTETDGTTTTTNHYSGSGDSPGWTSTSSTSWTRNLAGPDGNLALMVDQAGTATLQLRNLHGDTVATGVDDTSATGIGSYSETTEYGAPRNASSAYAAYGWLGAKQRSSGDLGGLTIMGVRLYNPATGRFLSDDSVPGGNANAYTYPANPVTNFDLTGRYSAFFGNYYWHWWGMSIYFKHSYADLVVTGYAWTVCTAIAGMLSMAAPGAGTVAAGALLAGFAQVSSQWYADRIAQGYGLHANVHWWGWPTFNIYKGSYWRAHHGR